MAKTEFKTHEQVNTEVEILLARFGGSEDETVSFDFDSPTYYPVNTSSMRQDCERFFSTLGELQGTRSYEGINPHFRHVRIDCNFARGRVIVERDRRGRPLYIASLELEPWDNQHSHDFKKTPGEFLKLLVSPAAFTPRSHTVWDVLNLHRNGSVYTKDQEGSNWSFHLEPSAKLQG